MNTCRLCLKVRVKMFRLGNEHKDFINSILKLKGLNDVDREDHHACYICMALLSKTFHFIQMVANAQKIFSYLLKTNDKLTIPMIMNIDRHKEGLNLVNLSYVRDKSFAYNPVEMKCHEVEEQFDLNTNESNKENRTIEEVIHNEIKEGQKNDQAGLVNKASNNYNYNKKEESCDDIYVSDDNAEILVEVECYVHDVKTERADPLVFENEVSEKLVTKDMYTEVTGGVELEIKSEGGKPIHEILLKKESSDTSKTKGNLVKRKYQRKLEEIIDKDYQPDSTSHSEDSDFDVYDDKGRQIRRRKAQREYPRKCDHCDYEVANKTTHFRHYTYEHPNIKYPYGQNKNIPCASCGKLMSKENIEKHEASHKERNIKCHLCPKICTNLAAIYRHRSTVHPKITYTCDYCSKIFKTRVDISRHFRIHTGEKPYKCHICGAGFAHSGNRTIHIRSAHQNYRYVPKKRQPTQKVRRNKKYDVTDTEMESSNEEIIQKKKIKRNEKRKSKKSNRSEFKNKKRTQKMTKNVTKNRRSKKESLSDDGADMKSKAVKQTLVCQSQEDDIAAKSDSDEEPLAEMKKKKIL